MAEFWIFTDRNSFFVAFLAKPTKTKTKPGKRKELCRNEFLSYGVKLEEDVDFSSLL